MRLHLDDHGDLNPVILAHLWEKLVQGELRTGGMHLWGVGDNLNRTWIQLPPVWTTKTHWGQTEDWLWEQIQSLLKYPSLHPPTSCGVGYYCYFLHSWCSTLWQVHQYPNQPPWPWWLSGRAQSSPNPKAPSLHSLLELCTCHISSDMRGPRAFPFLQQAVPL